MAKFRKKPVVIEAEEWVPGKQIDGVIERPSELIYSRNGKAYYVSVYDKAFEMSRYWLGVEKVPGPLTEEQKKGGGLFEPSWLEIRKPTGEIYCRSVYPFVTFDIKSGDSIPVADCKDDDLFQDYASIMRWPKRIPLAIGIVETLEGNMIASPGDWIITGVAGEKYPCKPDIFEKTYEPAE